jgi:hypothetical protein
LGSAFGDDAIGRAISADGDTRGWVSLANFRKLGEMKEIQLKAPYALWAEYEAMVYKGGLDNYPEQRRDCRLAFTAGIEALFKVLDEICAAGAGDGGGDNFAEFSDKVLHLYRQLNLESYHELAREAYEKN